MENNYSTRWKTRGTRQGLLRNALLKTMGYTDEDIEKPLIGIINTWSETNPGHYNFRMLSDAVKRGVWAAGGVPALMKELLPMLDGDCPTVSGKTVAENLAASITGAGIVMDGGARLLSDKGSKYGFAE